MSLIVWFRAVGGNGIGELSDLSWGFITPGEELEENNANEKWATMRNAESNFADEHRQEKSMHNH